MTYKDGAISLMVVIIPEVKSTKSCCRCRRILLEAAVMEVNLKNLYNEYVHVVDGNGLPLFRDTMLGTHQHQQALVRQKRVEGM